MIRYKCDVPAFGNPTMLMSAKEVLVQFGWGFHFSRSPLGSVGIAMELVDWLLFFCLSSALAFWSWSCTSRCARAATAPTPFSACRRQNAHGSSLHFKSLFISSNWSRTASSSVLVSAWMVLFAPKVQFGLGFHFSRSPLGSVGIAMVELVDWLLFFCLSSALAFWSWSCTSRCASAATAPTPFSACRRQNAHGSSLHFKSLFISSNWSRTASSSVLRSAWMVLFATPKLPHQSCHSNMITGEVNQPTTIIHNHPQSSESWHCVPNFGRLHFNASEFWWVFFQKSYWSSNKHENLKRIYHTLIHTPLPRFLYIVEIAGLMNPGVMKHHHCPFNNPWPILFSGGFCGGWAGGPLRFPF